MIVTRPLHDSEPDLLFGYEQQPLVVKNLDGKEVYRIDSPINGFLI